MRAKLNEAIEWRLKEIAQLKSLLPNEADPQFETLCRAAMVLSYAHWEGFFNECVEVVLDAIKEDELDVSQAAPGVVALFLSSEFDSLANKKINDDNLIAFLNAQQLKSDTFVSGADACARAASSRSNLDWKRLSAVFGLFGYSWLALNDERIFIQHKLAKLRHEIAHGSAPRLRRLNALEHLDKTEDLLNEVSEYFVSIFEGVLHPLRVNGL